MSMTERGIKHIYVYVYAYIGPLTYHHHIPPKALSRAEGQKTPHTHTHGKAGKLREEGKEAQNAWKSILGGRCQRF